MPCRPPTPHLITRPLIDLPRQIQGRPERLLPDDLRRRLVSTRVWPQVVVGFHKKSEHLDQPVLLPSPQRIQIFQENFLIQLFLGDGVFYQPASSPSAGDLHKRDLKGIEGFGPSVSLPKKAFTFLGSSSFLVGKLVPQKKVRSDTWTLKMYARCPGRKICCKHTPALKIQ